MLNPGYRSALPERRLAFLSTLSPTRRAEVERGLQLSDNAALNEVLHTLEAADPSDPAIRVLLDKAMKDAVLHQQASLGYRKTAVKGLTRGDEKGRVKLVPDKPQDYAPQEQQTLEMLSLRKAIGELQGDAVRKFDSTDPLFQRIARHNANEISTASKRAVASGGIVSVAGRANHADLPALTDQQIIDNTDRQIYDNLAGNEIGEQPSGKVDRLGNRSSYPVEHKAPFKHNPERGYETENRMLGGQSKNSVLRAEEDPIRQQVLLSAKLAEMEGDYISKYGETIQEYMGRVGMNYRIGMDDMPDY